MSSSPTSKRPVLTAQQLEDRKRPYCVVLPQSTPAGVVYKVLSQWTNRQAAEAAVAKTGRGSVYMTAAVIRKNNQLVSEQALTVVPPAAPAPVAAPVAAPAAAAAQVASVPVPPKIVPQRPVQVLADVLHLGLHVPVSDDLLYRTDNDHLREAIYGLQVDMQYQDRYFPFIDARVFVPVPPVLSYPELRVMDQEELVDAFRATRVAQLHQFEQGRDRAYSLHFDEGRQLSQLTRDLKVTGSFVMVIGKICGYLTDRNELTHGHEVLLAGVIRALREISYQIPLPDDAFNVGHTDWIVEGRTVMLKQRCAELYEISLWERFFHDHILTRPRELFTDQLFFELSDNLRPVDQRPAHEIRITFDWS